MNDSQLYNSIADLYALHRPQYPEILVQKAIKQAKLTVSSSILEIGCGPGTATVAFAGSGVQLTCIEPSESMVKLAQKACVNYPNVTFVGDTFENWYSENLVYDALLAASSFHWLLKSGKTPNISKLLKSNGYLIFMWNLPPEPNSEIRSLVAQKLGLPEPFFFGQYSDTQHRSNIIETVLGKISETQVFSEFSYDAVTLKRDYSIDDYLAFLRTLSPYIPMDSEIKTKYFLNLQEALSEISSPVISTEYTSILNMATKNI